MHVSYTSIEKLIMQIILSFSNLSPFMCFVLNSEASSEERPIHSGGEKWQKKVVFE